MDRRKVLIGSGTAFTIALAGCMGGDDDDDGDEEPTERTGAGGGDDDGDDNGDDNGDDDLDDIVDVDDLKLHTERVGVRDVKKDGDTLVVMLELKDHKKREAVEDVGRGLQNAVKDVDHLLQKIDWLKVVLYDGDQKVAAFKIHVDWLEKLLKEEIDPEELADHVDDMDGDTDDD